MVVVVVEVVVVLNHDDHDAACGKCLIARLFHKTS